MGNYQFGDLEARLADAEAAAAKGGKAAMAKLEGKVRELEAELAGTQARYGEAAKAYQRSERKVKELQFSQSEDKKNQDRMSEIATKTTTTQEQCIYNQDYPDLSISSSFFVSVHP